MPKEPPAPLPAVPERYECRTCGPLTRYDIEDDGTCKGCGRYPDRVAVA